MSTYHHADGSKSEYFAVDHYVITHPDHETVIGKPLYAGHNIISSPAGVFSEAEWMAYGWKVEKIYKEAPTTPVGIPNFDLLIDRT